MFYGLDVHKRFIQVCELGSGGERLREFRIEGTAETISAFARKLGPEDQVVLEATFHSWAIWSLLVPHVGKMVVANPMQVKAIAHARVKTDKVDALILAQLLQVGFIPEVEMPSESTWALRELVSHRRFLSKQLVALRNRIGGVVNGRLYHCLLGAKASETLDAKLLMTIPGVNITVAIGLLSAIGDISRFGPRRSWLPTSDSSRGSANRRTSVTTATSPRPAEATAAGLPSRRLSR